MPGVKGRVPALDTGEKPATDMSMPRVNWRVRPRDEESPVTGVSMPGANGWIPARDEGRGAVSDVSMAGKDVRVLAWDIGGKLSVTKGEGPATRSCVSGRDVHAGDIGGRFSGSEREEPTTGDAFD